jgi:hypothetical protein
MDVFNIQYGGGSFYMANTFDLNSTTPVNTQIAVHTTSYSQQTFKLKSGEFRYFEISTTENWEHVVEIGTFETESGYFLNDNFTGYSVYVNWRSSSITIYLVTCIASIGFLSSVTRTMPESWTSTTRLGIAVSPEMLKFYLNNTEIGTYNLTDGYNTTDNPGVSLVDKDLKIGVTGFNNVAGGVLTCYFDPSLWTTNSANYSSINGSSIKSIIKTLVQY